MAFAVTPPALTSSAIIAALGFTPASSAAVTIANGTVTAPGMIYATETNMGFYLEAAATATRSANMGIAQAGRKSLSLVKWDVAKSAGDLDGTLMVLGEAQTWSTDGAEAYIATIFAPTQTMSALNRGMVFANIFGGQVTLTANGTYTQPLVGLETDKTDVVLGGGATAVTINRPVGLRVRSTVPTSGVTLVDAAHITFALNNAVTGATVTNSIMALFNDPTAGGLQSSNYIGCRFDGAYSGGHLQTKAGVTLDLRSAAGITLAAASGAVGITASTSNTLTASGGTNTITASTSNSMVASSGTNTLTASGQNIINNGAASSTAFQDNGTTYLTVQNNGGYTQLTSVGTNRHMLFQTPAGGTMLFNPTGSTKLDYGGNHTGGWAFSAPVYIEASHAFFRGKATDPGTAPGAGYAKTYWVAGTNAGTAKLVAYAGTSTTPTTIIDNVGGGF